MIWFSIDITPNCLYLCVLLIYYDCISQNMERRPIVGRLQCSVFRVVRRYGGNVFSHQQEERYPNKSFAQSFLYTGPKLLKIIITFLSIMHYTTVINYTIVILQLSTRVRSIHEQKAFPKIYDKTYDKDINETFFAEWLFIERKWRFSLLSMWPKKFMYYSSS